VFGDIIWFEEPDIHKDKWDEVGYDYGDTDFPSSADFLVDLFEKAGAKARHVKMHPLAGIIIADFQ